MPRPQSGAAIDRPEITNLLRPPTTEVVWQLPQETHLINFHKKPTTGTPKNTHMPKFRHINDVESPTLPIKEISPQVFGSSKEPFLGNQTGSTPVQSLNDSKKRQSEIQRLEMKMTTTDNGDDNLSCPKNNFINSRATCEG